MIKERKKKAEGKEKAIQDVIVQNQLLEKERKQEIKLRSQAAEMRKLELAEHREQEALKKQREQEERDHYRMEVRVQMEELEAAKKAEILERIEETDMKVKETL